MTPNPDPLDGCWTACDHHEAFPYLEPVRNIDCLDCIRASMMAVRRKAAVDCIEWFERFPKIAVKKIRRKYGLEEEKGEDG